MTDDGGVLGNLPRSRPGHRSEKRTATTAAKTAGGAGPPKRPPKAATESSRTGADGTASRPGDPVGDAIRTVAGVASTGARVAGGVAREVLRRLPRP
jgi:hypothetical protein